MTVFNPYLCIPFLQSSVLYGHKFGQAQIYHMRGWAKHTRNTLFTIHKFITFNHIHKEPERTRSRILSQECTCYIGHTL